MKAPHLTGRERDIVAVLTATAGSNREIAQRTGLTEGTVKEYLTRICRKFGLRNRVEVAVWAARQGVGVGSFPEGLPPRVA